MSQFVPNVGLAISLILPMPIVLLDPRFGPMGVALTFLGPLAVGLLAKGGPPLRVATARVARSDSASGGSTGPRAWACTLARRRRTIWASMLR